MKPSNRPFNPAHLLALLLWTLSPLHSLAQDSDAAPSPEPCKVGVILKDIKKIESGVNAQFNQLNSDDKYDLVCYSFTATGSKLKQRICEPRFMKDARKNDSQRFVSGNRQGTDTAVPNSDSTLQSMMQDEISGLRQELQSLMKESPEFSTGLVTLQSLVKEYAAHEKARNNDPALGFLARFLQTNNIR